MFDRAHTHTQTHAHGVAFWWRLEIDPTQFQWANEEIFFFQFFSHVKILRVRVKAYALKLYWKSRSLVQCQIDALPNHTLTLDLTSAR